MLGAYDPEPDYFFHWFRDSAVVVDALRILFEDEALDGEFFAHFADFVPLQPVAAAIWTGAG